MPRPSAFVQPESKLTQRPSRRKRSGLDYMKCRFCRTDKQKCIPSQRQWPGEKCQRCAQKGLPCSEPHKARSSRIAERSPSEPSVAAVSLETPAPLSSVNETPGHPKPTYILNMSRNQAQRLDFLVAMRHIIIISTCQLKQLAQDMARPFEKMPVWIDHARCLDTVFIEFDKFAAFIKSKILATECSAQALLDLDLDLDITYGNYISKSLSEERIELVRQKIIDYQHAGRYGSAYLIQVELLVRCPRQITDADRHRFEEIENLFRAYLSYGPFFQEVVQHAPLPCELSSLLFFPILPMRFLDDHPSISALLLHSQPSKYGHFGKKCQDFLGRTPSHILIDAGSQKKWLEDDIQHKDILGRTALYFACRDGDKERAMRLLESGAYALQRTVTGLSPVHIAAVMGHTNLCHQIWWNVVGGSYELLVKDYRDCAFLTPAHYAAGAGHAETIKYFCTRTVPFYVAQTTDRYGNTALSLAVRGGHIDVVHTIWKYSCEEQDLLDVPNCRGRTPFWYAVQGSHYLIMEKLVDIANPDHEDTEGRTPLAEAARRGDEVAVEFLLGLKRYTGPATFNLASSRVNPDSKDNDGKSPLHLAAMSGNLRCVEMLLAHGHQPHLSQARWEVLEIARNAGNSAMVQAITSSMKLFRR